MKNLKEFSKDFFAKKKKYERREQTLQDRLDKVKSDLAMHRRKRPMPENVIEPLALDIQKELKAKAYYVVDIDSMFSTVTIHWVSEPDMIKCKNKDKIAMLEISISSYDEKVSIVERDKDGRRQYIKIHGNKGVKWLAKYAKQNLKNS